MSSSPPNLSSYTQSNRTDSSSSSSHTISPSILTLILILSIAIIVFTSLCLVIRFLKYKLRRQRQQNHNSVSDDVTNGGGNVTVLRDNRFTSRRVYSEEQSLIDSLPAFKFGSVSNGSNGGSLTGGDCAVCLSKFEPDDQLRLLPICCHAFHADCVDTWLTANLTCPLCRSAIVATESEIMSKILASSAAVHDGDREIRSQSFRIEIGNVSRRQDMASFSGEIAARRSYSIGSFRYVVEDESQVTVVANHARGNSFSSTFSDKDESMFPKPSAPSLADEVGSDRSWLREYVDMISERVSHSSRALSFRSSGRFFTGSSRRSAADMAGNYDVEANRAGEEISEWFRWFSGV